MSRPSRIINLGKTISYLQNDGIPNLLSTNISNKYIDHNIKLRLFPLSVPILPTLSGQVQYLTCLNTLRLLSNKFLLDKNVNNIPHKLNILTIDPIKDTQLSQNKLFITTNDKLLIKWQTSPDILTPLQQLGNYTRVKDGNFTENKNNRMIKGNFILELNHDNTQILVHTIENIEFYHVKKKQGKENRTNVSMC
ncbi:hypothetical protein MOSE0_M09274 [Monosporozyma servazzii]